jgi:DNA-binding Lrp family transcriptional regulator
MAVEAYILIQAEAGELESVVRECNENPAVLVAKALSGPYDVIAHVHTETLEDLNRLVLKQIQQFKGITRTLTCPVMNF